MIRIDIPGFENLSLEHLVLDFNGTLAVDGKLMPGVHERLCSLATQLKLHVLTADTFGHVREALQKLPVALAVLEPQRQAEAKRDYLRALAPGQVVAIGNGRNDRLMLQAAALSMAVSSLEGTAVEALLAAHLYLPTVHEALDALESPQRLIASLRD